MTDKQTPPIGNAEKDPADWVTGDEPMTGAQRSYLKTLSEEAHVEFDETLSKADASKRIDELQHQTGRGLPPGQSNQSKATGPGADHDEDGTTMSVGPSD